jgi:hypothetical protein
LTLGQSVDLVVVEDDLQVHGPPEHVKDVEPTDAQCVAVTGYQIHASEKLRIQPLPLERNSLEEFATSENLRLLQASSYLKGLTFVADTQLLATFSTPSREHCTPGFRRHSSAEAMRVSSLAFMRLERSLHANS